MNSRIVIAIDGPAGAGKSTVTKVLAKKLGLTYLDTGAMYRALAFSALQNRVDVTDKGACEALAAQSTIEFKEGEPQRVILNQQDVTDEIRMPSIGDAASAISVHSGVRRVLVAMQKAIVAKGGVVLEGRDTTTVVAPNATVKVFLTASADERARRRFEELRVKGIAANLDEIKAAIIERDSRDTMRADSPLTVAPDAVQIQSDHLTPEEIVEKIAAIAIERAQ